MKLITIDFETFYGDGYSLSNKGMTTESYIRDPRFKCHGAGIKINGGISRWVTARHLPAVFAKLDLPNNVMVGHNLQFDGSILAWHYGIYPKLYIDTLGLSRYLIGPHSARHGLTYVAELVCGMSKMEGLAQTYNKRDLTPYEEKQLADYCVAAPHMATIFNKSVGESETKLVAGDTELTYALLQKLLPLFPKTELRALDWTIRAFTNPRLLLDTQMLEQYIVEVQQAKAQALIDAGLETRDLLMSNQKYAQALEELGVNVPTKINAKGKVTFAFAKTDDAHKRLLEHDDPKVQALVSARLQVKSTIEETRAMLYYAASSRGYWPAAYNFAGAFTTGRYSGNKGGGGNPQNLKRGGTLRKTIYAEEGFLLGVADLSQIECRATLWFGMQIAGPDSEEAKALQVMKEGGDIYGWFGTKIYGYPINKKDTPFERQISKSAVLGLGYGMGAGRFVDYCLQSGIKGVDIVFAEQVVALYRDTFTGVKRFWRECQKAVVAMIDERFNVELPFSGHRILRTARDPLFNEPCIICPGGFMIKYPGLQKDPEGQITFRDGHATIKLFGGKTVQHIMEAVTSTMMRAQKTELSKFYTVVMTTHDELVSIIPEEDGDIKDENGKKIGDGVFSKRAWDIMGRDVVYMPGLPVGIETDTAIRYGDAK